MIGLVLAAFADPPAAFAPTDVRVALLPGAERAVLASRQGVFRVGVKTGGIERIGDGGHPWGVQHLADGVRVGIDTRVLTFDASGGLRDTEVLEHDSCLALGGAGPIVAACTDWSAGTTVFPGWGVTYPGYARAVAFHPDGTLAVLRADDGVLVGIGAEGVRWTAKTDDYAELAVFDDRIVIEAGNDLEVRTLDGALVRTVRYDGQHGLADLGDRVLAGGLVVHTGTGEVRPIDVPVSFSTRDGRDGIAVSAGDLDGRFQLCWTDGTEVACPVQGAAPLQRVEAVGDALVTFDRAGRARRWEGGRQTGFVDTGSDGGVVGFGVLPDATGVLRSGEHALERWPFGATAPDLSLPGTSWRSDIGVLRDRFITAGDRIEVRGFDLRIRSTSSERDCRRVLGPWVEVDGRWQHAITGEKRGAIESPMVDGDHIADPASWNPEAYEGAMSGDHVAVVDPDAQEVQVFRGKKRAWTFSLECPGCGLPVGSRATLVGIRPDGTVLLTADGAVIAVQDGKVVEVLYGLAGDRWARWAEGAVTGDRSGLW
ncbi:MAG: hypothetical protein R3F61_23765 [Myxococcota bacterium]